ncbi:5198_t:CDS:2, partial [Acaulospora colombiana]
MHPVSLPSELTNFSIGLWEGSLQLGLPSSRDGFASEEQTMEVILASSQCRDALFNLRLDVVSSREESLRESLSEKDEGVQTLFESIMNTRCY